MKQITIGVFEKREDAEKAINQIHNELKIPNEDISYTYRNNDGEVKAVDAAEISSPTAAEGAKEGALVGGSIGALAGIAAIAGLIPIAGPIFAAGPIAAALGLTGALGTAAAGAATGAAAGGIIGALVNLGVGEENAKHYADRVQEGDILLAVHADEEADVAAIMGSTNAMEVNEYKPAM